MVFQFMVKENMRLLLWALPSAWILRDDQLISSCWTLRWHITRLRKNRARKLNEIEKRVGKKKETDVISVKSQDVITSGRGNLILFWYIQGWMILDYFKRFEENGSNFTFPISLNVVMLFGRERVLHEGYWISVFKCRKYLYPMDTRSFWNKDIGVQLDLFFGLR